MPLAGARLAGACERPAAARPDPGVSTDASGGRAAGAGTTDAQVLRPDHPHAVRIRRFEAAAGAGDPSDVAATYAADVVVHAGSGPVGGSTRGPVLERTTRSRRRHPGVTRLRPAKVVILRRLRACVSTETRRGAAR